MPTDAEWTALTTFLGGEFVASDKLKETGTTHWQGPNTGATNESGFTALPCASRYYYGTFSTFGETGNWWSSSEYGTLWSLGYNWDNMQGTVYDKRGGFSVRCVSNVTLAAGFPVITTTAATYNGTTIATSGGEITSDGGAIVTERGICWNTTQKPTIVNSKTSDYEGIGSFTSKMTGLTPNTTYFCRSYATNSVGTAYGNEISFKTTPIQTVTDVDGNVYNTVIIGTQVWMVENLKTTKFNDGTNIPNVTQNTSWSNRLTPGYCWYDNNIINKSSYGALYNWYTVNTGRLAPKGWHVPTDAEWQTLRDYVAVNTSGNDAQALASKTDWASSIWTGAVGNDLKNNNTTGFTAFPGGLRYSSDGGFDYVGLRGYWWSSTESYDTSASDAWDRYMTYDDNDLNRVFDVYKTKSCGFSVRCVWDNNAPSLPILNTIAASSITSISAISGGNITSDGGSVVTERGMCYSTNKNPTTSNSKVVTGSGTGTFNVTLTGLSPNKTYYIRAYATNNVGTGYGNEILFKTFTGTVSDIEGNVYNTVTIGTQVWMVENLKTTKFNDGTNIPNVTDDESWIHLSTPGYCWYNNNVSNKNIYGALYNWYTVNTGKLAPKGWHVPTDAEWTNIDSVAGYKLSDTSQNTGATNETGFTALPGGYRLEYGGCYNIGYECWWWSSTKDSSTIYTAWYAAWGRRLTSNSMSRMELEGVGGFSVRCIRDF